MSRILIIKLGALGDFFMAQPALRALRAHHREDHLTLLTIPALHGLARQSGLFDEVLDDPRGRWPWGHWQIARRLREGGYTRIYDLQGTRRTAWYFRLLRPPRPEWAGPVRGCALPRPPRPPGAHRADWYAAQLAELGIVVPAQADPTWLQAPVAHYGLPPNYLLIAAGGSAHRPAKRWPTDHYAALCAQMMVNGFTPILLGTDIDAAANRTIAGRVPGVRDLTARTSVAEIASLARGARAAIGNDTGPMHVIAATGCPSIVLYSAESDPGFVAPLGASVRCLQRDVLSDLAPSAVLATLQSLVGI